jgi:hypothetical protein
MVSSLLAINYRRCRCYRRLIIAWIIVTGKKFIAGVMESMKIQDKALSRLSPRIFVKLCNSPKWDTGALGKLILEKS